jgi:hypothetical protein
MMSDYDFKTLNDKEFEILAADLAGARDSVHFERFKPGRDLGVDGRYFTTAGEEVVLQSKHWAATTLGQLVKHLQAVEVVKVRKLRPKKYVLAVSHPLSRMDKQRITAIFTPFIVTPSDVLGREDLNDLLSKNQEIERRHYKLWISSSAVLSHLINKAIYDRSSFAMSEILDTAHLYVPTQSHDKAVQKLEKLGTVIITGPAGIGKTTLAEHLCLHYLNRKFNLVKIGEEIREAENVFDPNQDQIFYFDDFLGRNYLEALSGHEGAHIVQFIKRIVRDRRKRFVLTSRTTILNQGKLLLDVLQNSNLDKNEFEVTLDSFSEMDRARILYNRLWHSNLGSDHEDAVYQDKRYKQIIRHRNYNPRLIHFITDPDKISSCSPCNYWEHIKKLLENPTTVWQNPFEAQTDDFGRIVVLLVALNGRPISQTDLAEAYHRYTSAPDATPRHGKQDFLLNLKHLAGSLLSRTISANEEVSIDLFNPSIGDYVLHRYATDIPALRIGFASLRSTASLNTLADLAENRLLSEKASASMPRHLVQNAIEAKFIGYAPEYVALACLQIYDPDATFDANDPLLPPAIQFLLESQCPTDFEAVAEVVYRALQVGLVPGDQAARFAFNACAHQPRSNELRFLGAIQSKLSEELRADLLAPLKEAAVEWLLHSVDHEFSDDAVFDSVSPHNLDRAEARLRALIVAKFDEYSITPSAFDVEQIIEEFDVDGRAESYLQSHEEDQDEVRPAAAAFHLDEIDDLFDRTR